MRSFTLKLPDDVAERLEAEAARQGVSSPIELIGGWVMEQLSAIDNDPTLPPLTPMQHAALEEQFERDTPQIMAVIEQRLADGPVGRPLDEAFDAIRQRLRQATADRERKKQDDQR